MPARFDPGRSGTVLCWGLCSASPPVPVVPVTVRQSGGARPHESWSSDVSKRTFQPNNRRRAKVHGFRLRMRTRAGRAILSARRTKGRAQISA